MIFYVSIHTRIPTNSDCCQFNSLLEARAFVNTKFVDSQISLIEHDVEGVEFPKESNEIFVIKISENRRLLIEFVYKLQYPFITIKSCSNETIAVFDFGPVNNRYLHPDDCLSFE